MIAAPKASSAAHSATEVELTEEQTAEAERQRSVRLKRACMAVQHGTAPMSILGGDAEKKMDDFNKNEASLQKKLQVDHKRIQKVQQLPKAILWTNHTMFMHESAKPLKTKIGDAQWNVALQRLGVVEVADCAAATAFLVFDPADPGETVRAVASMVGGLLCTPDYFYAASRDKHDGVALKLNRALGLPRAIFVSSGSMVKQGASIKLLQRVAGLKRPNRWTFFMDDDASIEKYKARCKARTGSHAAELVTLVTKAEMRQGRYSALKRKTGLRDFLNSIYTVDGASSRQGMCRR